MRRVVLPWRDPVQIDIGSPSFASGLQSRYARALIIVIYLGFLSFAIALLSRYGGTLKDAGWTWRSTSGGVVVETVDPHGLAVALPVGAHVLAVNGDPRASRAGPRPWLQDVQPGQTYTVSWQATRNSSRGSATLTMGRGRSTRDLLMAICDLFVSVSFFCGGLLVFWAKPAGTVTRICHTAAFLMSLYLIGSALGPISPLLTGPSLVIYFLLRSVFPFYVTAGCAFFAVFPTGQRPATWVRVWLRVLWIGAIAVWAIILPNRILPLLGIAWRLPVLSGLDLRTRPELGLLPVRHGYVVLCGLFLVVVAAHNYRDLTDAAMRLRVRWVILGSIFGAMPSVLTSLILSMAGLTLDLTEPNTSKVLMYYSVSTLTLVVMPFTVAYAVICHRLMGIRVAFLGGVHIFLARRVLRVLTLLPAILVGGYFVFYRHAPVADLLSHYPVGAIAITLAALIAIFRKELLDWADKVFRRLPDDRDRVLRALLQLLLEQRSEIEIARVTAACVKQLLQPDIVLIYCESGEDQPISLLYTSEELSAPRELDSNSGLIRLLAGNGTRFLKSELLGRLPGPERAWLARARIVLAAPLQADINTEPAGVLLLGRKRSRENYTASDLDCVNDIARQVYLALKLRETERSLDLADEIRRQAEELFKSLASRPARAQLSAVPPRDEASSLMPSGHDPDPAITHGEEHRSDDDEK